MQSLTKEEIEMIERDCRETITNELIFLDEYLYGNLQKIVNKLIKEVYVTAATKYLTQLKEERERAGKLLELLTDINKSLYVGEDLKDGEILDWYMRVIDTITGEIGTAITEYKNNNQ